MDVDVNDALVTANAHPELLRFSPEVTRPVAAVKTGSGCRAVAVGGHTGRGERNDYERTEQQQQRSNTGGVCLPKCWHVPTAVFGSYALRRAVVTSRRASGDRHEERALGAIHERAA